MHILNIADIELVEGDRNYVKFSVGREQYHARSTLQQAEASLASQPMLRISRSCLINVNYIRELSRTPRGDFIFVLACGTTVTSSECHREGVRERLNGMKLGTG
jgi:two-component system LytT family response regulator